MVVSLSKDIRVWMQDPRRLAGRMTARYDIDITNVALYWHFTALTAVITVAVIAGFPLVA
jgi:hypothetical protein